MHEIWFAVLSRMSIRPSISFAVRKPDVCHYTQSHLDSDFDPVSIVFFYIYHESCDLRATRMQSNVSRYTQLN